MSIPSALLEFVEPWSRVYGDSVILPTLVTFGHIGALVFAGGLAISLDRATLRAAHGSHDDRDRQLRDLGDAHRIVVAGLALSLLTGVLLLTADLETYLTSWIFWTKASLITLLLVNGYGMVRAEARVRANPDGADASWASLRRNALTSIVLWFAVAFAGVALVNAA